MARDQEYDDGLLADTYTTGQVAGLLEVHPTTVKQWRVDGKGPVYLRIGKKVRYRLEDLEAFIQIVTPRA